MTTFTWQDRIAYFILSSPLVLFPSHVPWYMTIVAWAFIIRAITPSAWHDKLAAVIGMFIVLFLVPLAAVMAIGVASQ
jgi:hypothetical protein